MEAIRESTLIFSWTLNTLCDHGSHEKVNGISKIAFCLFWKIHLFRTNAVNSKHFPEWYINEVPVQITKTIKTQVIL